MQWHMDKDGQWALGMNLGHIHWETVCNYLSLISEKRGKNLSEIQIDFLKAEIQIDFLKAFGKVLKYIIKT